VSFGIVQYLKDHFKRGVIAAHSVWRLAARGSMQELCEIFVAANRGY
jgi:hypothetical protein